jgi:hypothetical protein
LGLVFITYATRAPEIERERREGEKGRETRGRVKSARSGESSDPDGQRGQTIEQTDDEKIIVSGEKQKNHQKKTVTSHLSTFFS